MITKNSHNTGHSEKENLSIELGQSAIAPDFNGTTFHWHEGGHEGLNLFLHQCNFSDSDRTNTGKLSSGILKRYDHLTQGFWYVKSWHPLQDSYIYPQFKPIKPCQGKDQKPIKYETPKGQGTPFIFPYIPYKLIQSLAKKHKIDSLPSDTDKDKWGWIKDNSSIPIIITEGTKKACSLISQGFIAIASMSITTHSEKADEETSAWFTELKPELLWLLGLVGKNYEGKRTIFIAFDRENPNKIKSIKNVNQQTKTLGYKLSKKGHDVKVIQWSSEDGKGIDDFIAKKGKKQLRKIIAKAINYNRFVSQLKVNYHYKLSYPTIDVNTQYFDAKLITALVDSGKKFIGLKGSQKTGKTTALADFVKTQAIKGKKVLSISFRQLLARFCAEKFKLFCYLDTFNPEDYYSGNGDSISFDSLLRIKPDEIYDYIILDEIEQGLWHLLNAPTEIKNKRGDIIVRFNELLNNCLSNEGAVVGLDADLSDKSIGYIRDNCGNETIAIDDVMIIKNAFKPFADRDLIMINNPTDFRAKIIDFCQSGKRFMVCLSGQKVTSGNGSINIEQLLLNKGILPEQIYRIDQETISDPDAKEFCIIDNPEKLKSAKIILATASLGTGVSLDTTLIGELDAVFLFNGGTLGVTESEQMIERYRGDCPRICYLPHRSNNKKGDGSTTKKSFEKHILGKLQATYYFSGNDYNVFCHKQIGHYANFASRINNDFQNLRLNFQIKMEGKGYNVIEKEKEIQDKKIIKALREEAQVIKEISERKYTNSLFNTDCPEENDYLELKKKKTKTAKERLEQKRGDFRQSYGFLPKTESNNELFHELAVADLKGIFSKLQLRYFLEFGHEVALDWEKNKAMKDKKYRDENSSMSYFLDEMNRYKYSAKTFIFEQLKVNFGDIISGKADKVNDEELTEFKELQGKKDKNDIEKAKRNKFCHERLINNFELMEMTKVFGDAINSDSTIKYTFYQYFDININSEKSPMELFKMILNRLGYELESVARVRGLDSGKPDRFYAIKSMISPEIIEEIFDNWWSRHQKELYCGDEVIHQSLI